MAYITTLGSHFREGVAIVSGRNLFSSRITKTVILLIIMVIVLITMMIRIIIIIM